MGLLALWATVAQAQTAPVSPQDKAAMERAQREAEGPRRRIIEAAKLKNASRPPEPPPLPVLTPAPAPAPVAMAAPRATPRSESAEPEPALAVLSPAAPPLQLQNASFAMSGITTVAPVALAASAPSMINVPPTTVQQLLAMLPPPRLLSKVDPELPGNLFRRGARRTELVVDLVVNTDGSVRDVALRDSPNPEFEAPVLDAVRQWRYEPQPVARPQTVRLVVTPG